MKSRFCWKFVYISMVLLPLPLCHHVHTGYRFRPFSCPVDTRIKTVRARYGPLPL